MLILDARKVAVRNDRLQRQVGSARYRQISGPRRIDPRAKQSKETLRRLVPYVRFREALKRACHSTTLQLEHPTAAAAGGPIALGERCARVWRPAHNYVCQRDRLAEGPSIFLFQSEQV